MLSLAVSPVIAAAIMLPILIVMDMFALRGFKGRFDFSLLAQLFPPALIGVAAGAFSFHLFTEQSLKLLIAAVTLIFCGDALRKALKRRPQPPKVRSVVKGTFWSFLAGYTSFSVHAGGPPLNVYLLPLKLEKSLYVSTSIAFFTFINLVKVVPYITLGMFSQEILLTALVIAPLAPVGIWLGIHLHNRVNDQLFYQLCYGFLFITGLKLGYDALTMA
jgi:uncharacterized membrane protein YfcA